MEASACALPLGLILSRADSSMYLPSSTANSLSCTTAHCLWSLNKVPALSVSWNCVDVESQLQGSLCCHNCPDSSLDWRLMLAKGLAIPQMRVSDAKLSHMWMRFTLWLSKNHRSIVIEQDTAPARCLQFCMRHGMLALQASGEMLLTASSVAGLALKLCCICCLLQGLRPCHGAVERAEHVC